MAYIIGLMVIFAANFAAVRFGSVRTKRVILLASAGLPILLGVCVSLWFAYGYGLSATYKDPHFSIFWQIAAAATLATTVAAMLGRGLASRKNRLRTR